MSEPVDIEVVGGPEDSNFTEAELGALAPKKSVPHETSEPAATPVTENKTSETPAWKWAEDLPGSGNKPDCLLDKYTSVAEQARALPEALKRFGSFKGAPKDGYDMNNLPQGIDKDSPLLKGFTETFKEMNLDQDGFNKMAQRFAEIANSAVPTEEQIISEIGSKEVYERVSNWTKNFSPEVQETIKGWALSANDIKALDAIRAGRTPSSAPTSTQAESRFVYETPKAVEAEKNANWKRYQEDEAYRSEITRRWDEALNRQALTKGI